MTLAEVRLWGRAIGSVHWQADRGLASMPESTAARIQFCL